MEVAEQAVGSGPTTEAPPSSGNTNRPSLTDAITAAVTASRKAAPPPAPEKDEESVETTAGDERVSEPTETEEPKAKQAEEAKEGTEPDKAKAPETFEPPQHWPEADRKAFAGLAPEAQAIIRRLSRDLEAGHTRKSMELTDKARYAEAISGIIDDATRMQIRGSGMNETQYFAYLNDRQQHAARDPVGYVKWAMQNLGVTPAHLDLPTSPAAQQQPSPNHELEALLADPKVKQLESELAQVKGYLTEQQQAQLRAQQYHRMQAEQQLHGIATEFRTALNDAGQPRYPHFDSVRQYMGALMDTNPRLRPMPDGPEKMDIAYRMATGQEPLDPSIGTSYVESEVSKRMAAAEKAREAARAKAITAVKPSPGVVAQSAKPKSLDDLIRDQMSQRGFGTY
jgi:hypothetical protein